MKTAKDWMDLIDAGVHDGMSLADEERVIVKIIRQIQIDAMEHCALIAKAHRGEARKKRQARGVLLDHRTPDVAEIILSEERGEDIAAEEIFGKIQASRYIEE